MASAGTHGVVRWVEGEVNHLSRRAPQRQGDRGPGAALACLLKVGRPDRVPDLLHLLIRPEDEARTGVDVQRAVPGRARTERLAVHVDILQLHLPVAARLVR